MKKEHRTGRKKKPFLLRLMGKLIKCIAVLLACCIGLVALGGCITGSIVLSDILEAKGSGYYARISSKLIDVAKQALGYGETAEAGDAALKASLVKGVQEMAAAQAETDELLLAELESGAYTLDAPFVLVNPYGNSPLTAMLLFDTEIPAKITIEIAGDTPLAAVEHSFSTYNTRHQIPIYGLYANRENAVTLRAQMQDGSVQETSLSIRTDVLADDFSHERIRAYVFDEAAYAPGFTFTYRGNNSQCCKAGFDVNGEYRWYLDTGAQGSLLSKMNYCGSYNNGESLIFSCGSKHNGPVVIMEMNYLGKLLGAWYAPYGAHHDIVPNGDSILVTGSTDGPSVETLIYEIDRNSGEIITELDYTDILQVYRNQTMDYPEITNFYDLEDWCHINTVVPYGDDIIISSRHQSTVMCNDREGNIKWMLCDPADYYAYYQQYILTPVGDDFEYCYIQHAPEVLPDQDGNPHTVDILLFDNGDFRGEMSEFYSRMVQYRINEKEMTVEQVWSYGEDRTEIWSYRHGDADMLENGNRLGSFEPYDYKANTRSAYGVEVADDGSVVWECWRMSTDANNEYSEYRLERLEMYNAASENMQIGVQAEIFMPEIEEIEEANQ